MLMLCLQGLDNPSMFSYSLVQEAVGLHVPYLQCRKLFHTVSIPVLQGESFHSQTKEKGKVKHQLAKVFLE